MTTKHTERNVLVTVPLIVITSDESDEILNAFDVRTGFPDLYDR